MSAKMLHYDVVSGIPDLDGQQSPEGELDIASKTWFSDQARDRPVLSRLQPANYRGCLVHCLTIIITASTGERINGREGMGKDAGFSFINLLIRLIRSLSILSIHFTFFLIQKNDHFRLTVVQFIKHSSRSVLIVFCPEFPFYQIQVTANKYTFASSNCT